MINHGQKSFLIERGMRIAQLIVSPVIKFHWCEKEKLTETERSENGFGSTGIKN